MSKQLYILRHAKADNATDDHNRPLSVTGQQQAFSMGLQMQEKTYVPQLAYCSTALRAKQTLAEIQKTIPAIQTTYEHRLYNGIPRAGDVEDYATLIQGTDENCGRLLVIGHNPTIQMLCYALSGSDKNLLDYPVCQLSVFNVSGNWRNISIENCRLLEILNTEI